MLEEFDITHELRLQVAQKRVDQREGDPAARLPRIVRLLFPRLEDAARGVADIEEMIHQEQNQKI